MTEPVFTRLLPAGDGGPSTIDAGSWIEGLQFEPPAERPYVVVNFVASVDGRAQVDGSSGALGDDGDKAVFHALRERVDAVLAGTGTLAAERYGRILGRQDRRERRVALGRSAEPLAVTVTRSGSVPLDIPLFACEEARIVVFTGAAVPVDLSNVAASVSWERWADGSLANAMRKLRRIYHVETVLCEGGPTLFARLLHEGLVDELFLTLAPKLTGGGTGKTITDGPGLPDLAELTLRSVLERDGTLFLRYAVGI